MTGAAPIRPAGSRSRERAAAPAVRGAAGRRGGPTSDGPAPHAGEDRAEAAPRRSEDYHTLPFQVAARIVREIRQGTWVSCLPSERVLARTLQVSRRTLRKAIVQLGRDGVVETRNRRGHQILEATPAADGPRDSIGLLTPEPFGPHLSYTTHWVDDVRGMLIDHGLRLAVFSSSRYFTPGADKTLARLVSQCPQACWVLTHSNDQVQRWFERNRVPCVVAGSCSPGIALPNLDTDYATVCRHAVGALLRHGHRRAAFLTEHGPRGGDLASETGFAEAVQRARRPDIHYRIARHQGTVEDVWRTLGRLYDGPSPPTALLIAKPAFYLTAVAFLAKRRLQVGQDVSLLCRDYDFFLSYLEPRPACYQLRPKSYARRLCSLVLTLARNQAVTHPHQRFAPEFVPGASLAPPTEPGKGQVVSEK
ncbi:MAG: substrate-binding domain-containing protein [Opitutaceae bacterium]|nr:substrate-binding domain-containing protein [Opitutaceae bacterium]